MPFRLVVSDLVNRQALAGKVGVSGKVEAGALAVGGRVLLVPQGAYAMVKDVQVQGVSQAVAIAGQSVDIGLDAAPPDLEPGSVLCHSEYPLHVATSFRVCLCLLVICTAAAPFCILPCFYCHSDAWLPAVVWQGHASRCSVADHLHILKSTRMCSSMHIRRQALGQWWGFAGKGAGRGLPAAHYSRAEDGAAHALHKYSMPHLAAGGAAGPQDRGSDEGGSYPPIPSEGSGCMCGAGA